MFFFRLSAQQNDLTSKKHVDKADFINNLRRAVNDDNHVCECVCVLVCLFICFSLFAYLLFVSMWQELIILQRGRTLLFVVTIW